MELSRIHELNKLAGEFCGKELEEVHLNSVSRWFYTNERGRCVSWNPCVKHDQAAEVKATLREKGYGYQSEWHHMGYDYHSCHIHMPDEFKYSVGRHKSELIALLLAVEALGKKGR